MRYFYAELLIPNYRMKAFLSYVLLAAAVLSVGSCGRDSSKRSAGAGEPDTVASYWTDSTARKGLYVSSDSTQTASIYLNGAKYYATGTNCYELLLVSLHKKRDAQGRIDLSDSFAALDVLRRNGVGIVRFNCGVYFASELTAYTQNREEYLSALARLAAYAEKLEIGLIPSFFWIYTTVPDYVREPYRSWGIEGSRTTEFLKAYTTDVVEALKPYKSIFAWEFGNEFNLQADLPNWQKEFGKTDARYWIQGRDVRYAIRLFAETVRSLDPDGRMIVSGHSAMRPSQYHLNTEYAFSVDDTQQYRAATELFTPDPAEGMSEHVYEAGREFADRGKVTLSEQIAVAMGTARSLNKVYIVGEFGGLLPLKQAYRTYYDAFLDGGVALSRTLRETAGAEGDPRRAGVRHPLRNQSEAGDSLLRPHAGESAQSGRTARHRVGRPFLEIFTRTYFPAPVFAAALSSFWSSGSPSAKRLLVIFERAAPMRASACAFFRPSGVR